MEASPDNTFCQYANSLNWIHGQQLIDGFFVAALDICYIFLSFPFLPFLFAFRFLDMATSLFMELAVAVAGLSWYVMAPSQQ